MKTIRAAIAGATGYTGGELIRLLRHHPHVEIESLLSSRLAGQPVSIVHRDLYGDCDLCFTDTPGDADVLFLCLGHGLSRDFLRTHPLPTGCKVIDLGSDFRVDPTFDRKTFVYGLSEWFRPQIQSARYVANPGCFATAVLLALAPLAAAGWLQHDVHIHALTGSTGAGKEPAATTHFSYRASNISIYQPFVHRHLAEMETTLAGLSPLRLPVVNMIPMRGDFTRGIFAGLLTKLPDGITDEEVKKRIENDYAASPFVYFSASDVSLKEVVNTNKALINVHSRNGYLHLTAVIDNLLKGASGQAVQNMNLMCGLPEDCGLKLKGSAF
jgi:N-acetyl-gamma-glutamyl-phosphate reductase